MQGWDLLGIGKNILSLPRPLERQLQGISELLPETWIVRMHSLHQDKIQSDIPGFHSEQGQHSKYPQPGTNGRAKQRLWGRNYVKWNRITATHHSIHTLFLAFGLINYLLNDTHMKWQRTLADHLIQHHRVPSSSVRDEAELFNLEITSHGLRIT